MDVTQANSFFVNIFARCRTRSWKKCHQFFGSIASKHEYPSVSSYRIVQAIIPYPAVVCNAKETFSFSMIARTSSKARVLSRMEHIIGDIFSNLRSYRIIFFSIMISHLTNFQLFQELLLIEKEEKNIWILNWETFQK